MVDQPFLRPVPDAPQIRTALPGPRSEALLRRVDGALYPGTGHGVAPFVMAAKDGWTVTDVDGNVFLDMISAMASVPLGASRASFVDVAVEGLRQFGNDDAHWLLSPAAIELAELLIDVSPASLTRVDIALNGTEAVETAIRVMRRATGRPLIIGFHGSFHGETTVTAALGAEHSSIARGARAVTPGFVHVPYPHAYRSPFGPPRPGGTGDVTIDYLRDHLLYHVAHPGDVAGVIIEPVVGAGGVIAPPDTFWPALVDLCNEFGWLLCADEVKSGWGRTGTLFAVDRWGVQPDLMCLGKALGGGVMPIGALLGSEEVLGSFDDLSTGSTWSWLPAACAVAVETIKAMTAPGVLEHVSTLEAAARRTFGTFVERFPEVGDVRIVGALTAIEFVTDRETKQRDSHFQEAVAEEALRRGVIADSSSTSYNVQPSLVCPIDVFERGAAIIADAIDHVAGR